MPAKISGRPAPMTVTTALRLNAAPESNTGPTVPKKKPSLTRPMVLRPPTPSRRPRLAARARPAKLERPTWTTARRSPSSEPVPTPQRATVTLRRRPAPDGPASAEVEVGTVAKKRTSTASLTSPADRQEAYTGEPNDELIRTSPVKVGPGKTAASDAGGAPRTTSGAVASRSLPSMGTPSETTAPFRGVIEPVRA